MSFPQDQVAELKQLCGGVSQCGEGGCTFLLLSELRLPEGCSPSVNDALLCPTPRDGYQSRLFFAERIQTKNKLNWNGQVRIVERNWEAFSWKVSAEPRLIQMVAAHLRAFK
jgi:hypothetical protein